jgi:hypothetical protein
MEVAFQIHQIYQIHQGLVGLDRPGIIPGILGGIPGILIVIFDLPLKQRIDEVESLVSSST